MEERYVGMEERHGGMEKPAVFAERSSSKTVVVNQ
jgi:hypothetical protein